MIKCYFCGKEVFQGSHIYFCEKRPDNKSREEIRVEYLLRKYPLIKKDEFISDYTINKFSLPDLKTKYGINFKASLNLLRFWGVGTRTIKESANDISSAKTQKTCIEKYGSKSTFSKGCISYNKRIVKLEEKYGVNNSFLIPGIKEWIQSDELYIERFGKTRKQKRKEDSVKAWGRLTSDQKDAWLNASIFKEDGKSPFSHGTSSLELRIQKILTDLGISYFKQFRINAKSPFRYRFFDLLLTEEKVIIEVNGDYWHANPILYKENDVIKYPKGERVAQDIWENDRVKNQIAKDDGYSVFVIWESEMKELNDNDLGRFILNSLSSIRKGKKDDENC